ncbi:N-6 DNA methylase [Candidatus Woesearchaeota archaeon]|jgi:type I restriction enzyme M protein|nr:N-6 DNA methylase [Candidatus Woesearchaeota archaeon]MBT6336087.1 N-6 DNA methylase [Candidatus Woesearchaeota archaeon]MBT7927324.1 N-6 DNA methylase [Candidatus Woesearchaeota archaeon]
MLDKTEIEKIDELLDLFSKDNPTESIQQISYLIFLKQLGKNDEVNIRNAKIKGEKYSSMFNNQENCKWSNWNNMQGEEMIKHVRDVVFPFLRKLDESQTSYAKYLNNANFAISDGKKLTRAIKIINSDLFADKDKIGEIYHHLLSNLNIEKENKQYKTPDHIVNLMVDLVQPEINDLICDPTCATGTFLVKAYEHIVAKYSTKFKLSDLGTKEKNKLKNETFYGFNANQSMSRVAMMNLMTHGAKNPNITQMVTYSGLYKESDKYNVVLTNPPFSDKVSEDEVSEDFTISSKKSIILYLELIVRILRTGGRCAVIVPEGVLFGANKAEKLIKEKLLDDCRIDAIIKMHPKIFKPFGKDVSANIIVFTKGEPTKEILYYNMEQDGFTVDDKRTPTDKNDIPDIKDKFNAKNKPTDRKSKCFTVSIDEIKKPENNLNLNFSAFQEIVYKEIKYDDPEDIVEKLVVKEDEIKYNLSEIKKIMR